MLGFTGHKNRGKQLEHCLPNDQLLQCLALQGIKKGGKQLEHCLQHDQLLQCLALQGIKTGGKQLEHCLQHDQLEHLQCLALQGIKQGETIRALSATRPVITVFGFSGHKNRGKQLEHCLQHDQFCSAWLYRA